MMDELPAGTQLGAYRVISVIGRGGMGVVYLAEDQTRRRRVALKLLPPQFTGDVSFRARFERESRVAASLHHPNVLPIYDTGEVDGVLFVATMYVPGPDLRGVIDRDGAFAPERAIGIVEQVAGALDAAHTRGLVHGRVRPGGILIDGGSGVDGGDGGEHAYLTDFGLARQPATGSGRAEAGDVSRGVDYVAPEQLAGTPVDDRADVYALACVLFELLGGRPPFARDSDAVVTSAALHEAPPNLSDLRPELPPAVDAVFARALAERPEDRYPTAPELVHAAREALLAPAGSPMVAASAPPQPSMPITAAPPPQTAALPASRVPLRLIAIGIAGLALVLLAVAAYGLITRPPDGTPVGQVSPTPLATVEASTSASLAPTARSTEAVTPQAPTARPATPQPTRSPASTSAPGTIAPAVARLDWLAAHLPESAGDCARVPGAGPDEGSMTCTFAGTDEAHYLLFGTNAELRDSFDEIAASVETGTGESCATDRRFRSTYNQPANEDGLPIGELYCRNLEGTRTITWTNWPLAVLADLSWTGSDQSAYDQWLVAGPLLTQPELALLEAIPAGELVPIRNRCLLQPPTPAAGLAAVARCMLEAERVVTTYTHFDSTESMSDGFIEEIGRRGIPEPAFVPGDDWCGTPGVTVASTGYENETSGQNGDVGCVIAAGRSIFVWTDKLHNVMGTAERNDGDLRSLFETWEGLLINGQEQPG